MFTSKTIGCFLKSISLVESFEQTSSSLRSHEKMMCHPLGNLKWSAGNNLDDKTETVEHKCNCAITEKGVVITLKLGRIDSNFGAKTRFTLFFLF